MARRGSILRYQSSYRHICDGRRLYNLQTYQTDWTIILRHFHKDDLFHAEDSTAVHCIDLVRLFSSLNKNKLLPA